MCEMIIKCRKVLYCLQNDDSLGFNSDPFANTSQAPKDAGSFDAFGLSWGGDNVFNKSSNVSIKCFLQPGII